MSESADKEDNLPDPIGRVRPNAQFVIGSVDSDPSTVNPKLALLAMRVMSHHARLEAIVGTIFSYLIEGDPAVGAAIFAAADNVHIQQELLKAAAGKKLHATENGILVSVIKAYGSASKKRNLIAHGVWGYCGEIPEAVLVADDSVLVELYAKGKEASAQVRTMTFEEHRLITAERVMVYRESHFNEMLADIRLVSCMLEMCLYELTRNDPLPYGERLNPLLEQPQICRALNRPLPDLKTIPEVRVLPPLSQPTFVPSKTVP